ncbi:MAG: hypothetical protein MK175_04105 [Pseudoalteromonas sp.]|uniref:hypothetical protein n=1 Tax=Pseudoalteromonas sp. TaxID=53249 RepID=UPI0025ED750D|nr:hypothetical protein [Pseudoalteromonas sp.]MCH2086349.1 hypothetical protein [Pseudoalteromonas sp.]
MKSLYQVTRSQIAVHFRFLRLTIRSGKPMTKAEYDLIKGDSGFLWNAAEYFSRADKLDHLCFIAKKQGLVHAN